MQKKPKTGAQRQAEYASSGRPVAFVLRDDKALRSLARLEKKHGGVTAAMTAALIEAGKRNAQ